MPKCKNNNHECNFLDAKQDLEEKINLKVASIKIEFLSKINESNSDNTSALEKLQNKTALQLKDFSQLVDTKVNEVNKKLDELVDTLLAKLDSYKIFKQWKMIAMTIVYTIFTIVSIGFILSGQSKELFSLIRNVLGVFGG